MSIFHRFSGKFGPSAVAVSSSGHLFIARFEFEHLASEGTIITMNPDGEVLSEITCPAGPEITGMSFSMKNPNILYVTEGSKNVCLKVSMPPLSN